MRIGVCGKPEDVQPVEGLDFIEGTVGDLLCPRQDEKVFTDRLRALRASKLPVEAANCLIPGDLKSTGPEANAGALDAYMRIVLDRAGRMALKVLVFGSGGSRRVPEGFDPAEATDQLVAHLKRWAPLAAAAGVTLVVEPLNRAECNIVNSVDEGAGIVRRVDHPNVRLLIDTFHMARDGEGPESIVRAGKLIAHAHCADGEKRWPLGLGSEDHRPYFRALAEVGYTARMSIEASWQDFGKQLPDAVAGLRKQIDEA